MERRTQLLVGGGLVAGLALVFLVLSDRPAEDAGLPQPTPAPEPGAAAEPVERPGADEAEPTADPTAEPPRPTGRLNVSGFGWSTDFSIGNIDLSEIISGGPGKDGIPSIDEPRFETIEEAAGWLDAQAPVIAFELNGEARAYPLAILMWHEIVNDTLGGVPVVVTFCPLCNTALVFERELDGVLYDFGTTGNLRFSDLVMYDRQTESWWQQATGEAIVGVLTGTRLPFVPSQIVSLATFADTYPDAPVLNRDTGFTREYGRNPYLGYDRADQNPFLFRGVIDGRMAPMERVVAVSLGGEAVAYPYSELEQAGVVHDELGGQEIVVFWQAGVSSALDAARIDEGRDVGATGVFDPQVGDQRLSFTSDAEGAIFDRETGSLWSITGHAIEGELAGSRLEPVGHGDHFWFAWAAFEPETRIWTASP
jgi:hypothetical protein